MAYKLRTQKVVPGGLNLLAPGDQIQENDCLDLSNWFAGAAGKLEQALGAPVRNSPAVVSTQDSLCQTDGRIYYGGGGNLRQIGRAGDAAIDSGYDGTPLGMIGFHGYCWVMNRSRQKKDDGTTVTDWTPAAPGVVSLTDGGINGGALIPAVNNPPEVGGLLAQAYQYYATWQLDMGETNPSPVATITPAVDGSIVRVGQPAAAPANATGWNIYRRSPTFSAPCRLNEFVIAIARTYVDDYGDEVHTHSDTQLLQLGLIMESDHDAAPPARVIANNIYNDRIVVASSAANPNRMWFTQSQQPGFFRGSADANTGDWVDVGTDKGDAILAITTRPNQLIIYRQKSIWRQVGDFGETGARLEVIVPDLGIAGVRAVVSTSLGDYFVSNEGVYKFNNDWAQKVSGKVEALFRGLQTENLTRLGTFFRSLCAIGYRNGRVWVSYPDTNGLNGGSLVYHTESDRWFNAPISYQAFLDTGTEFLGAGPGVYSLESSYSILTGGVSYQSAYQDCDLPDHEKTWADLVLNHNTQGSTLTITVRTNKDPLSGFTLATINSGAMTKETIPMVYPNSYSVAALQGKPIRAYNLSIRITGSGSPTQSPIVIDSPILLHYYLEARQGRQFDTSVINHGTEMVKTVDQVEIDTDTTSGPASLQILSDIPGRILVSRLGTGTAVPQTSGQQSERLVLSTPVDGKLLRYQVTSPTLFQVYRIRARILPIGVYLDGTVGDFWQPQPISIGV